MLVQPSLIVQRLGAFREAHLSFSVRSLATFTTSSSRNSDLEPGMEDRTTMWRPPFQTNKRTNKKQTNKKQTNKKGDRFGKAKREREIGGEGGREGGREDVREGKRKQSEP